MQEASPMAAAPVSLEEEIAALHSAHSAVMLRYARAACADGEMAREAVQEAFLRYFIERSYGRTIGHPKGWLFEVLRNYLRDRASSAASQRELPIEHVERRVDLRPSPEAMVGGMQTAEQIADNLSPREMECLRLRTEGMSYGEIGEAMQVRIGTVGAMLARVHDKIRKFAGTDATGEVIAAAVFQLIQERKPCTLG
jgi:RNA polymerase sigma factor (sigma-70 family)